MPIGGIDKAGQIAAAKAAQQQAQAVATRSLDPPFPGSVIAFPWSFFGLRAQDGSPSNVPASSVPSAGSAPTVIAAN